MLNINPLIFRAYDIRGIAEASEEKPADLTEETVYMIGRATATYLIENYDTKNMAVGRDCRLTGPALQKAFIQGCLDAGLDVTDIGLAVSPMVYWASCTDKFHFDSATNITASHNPKQYNGVKTVAKNSHSICGDELQEVLKIIQTSSYHQPETPGTLTQEDIWPAYRDDLLTKTHIARPLKVVIDAGNATAGKFAPELLRAAGIEVTELYCDLDGNFPNHEANPEELENMHDLIDKVRELNADLGIGFDGDGDRVGIVDETGHLYSSDYITLLLARDLMTRRNPTSAHPKVVFDVKFSQIIINEMKALGLDTIMCKTGHSFIESKMKETGAQLAGEVSGHLFFAENYYGFDAALLAALKVCEITSQKEHPFSTHFADLPETFATPEFKAHCPDDQKFAIVQQLVDHFTANYDCTTIDGVRVNFDENSWGAVRASNTTPNLTLRFESDNPERLAEIQKIMADQISFHPEVSLEWYEE